MRRRPLKRLSFDSGGTSRSRGSRKHNMTTRTSRGSRKHNMTTRTQDFVSQQNQVATPYAHRFVTTALTAAHDASISHFDAACWDCIDAPSSIPAGGMSRRIVIHAGSGFDERAVIDLTMVVRP